jgi:hypothetical protein
MFGCGKLFAERMEEFEQLTEEMRLKALRQTCEDMAESERKADAGEINPMSRDIDLGQLGLPQDF